jgi:hypothetical protein
VGTARTRSRLPARLPVRFSIRRLRSLKPEHNFFSRSPPPPIAQAYFKVMASQVRPALIQPDCCMGLKQSALMIRRQPANSIRARDLASHSKAGCMAAIFSRDPKSKNTLGIEGASMYATEPTPSQAHQGTILAHSICGGHTSVTACFGRPRCAAIYNTRPTPMAFRPRPCRLPKRKSEFRAYAPPLDVMPALRKDLKPPLGAHRRLIAR